MYGTKYWRNLLTGKIVHTIEGYVVPERYEAGLDQPSKD